MPLTVSGNLSFQVTQDVTKQFDANVQNTFDWPFLWNLVQILPAVWLLLLLLRPANRTPHAALVLVGAAAAFCLAVLSESLKDVYWSLGVADGNTFTYLLYVASAWLLAHSLAKRHWTLRFILTLILFVGLALFGRVCFKAGDLQGGLFSSEWARNLTGAIALPFAALAARFLIRRKARQGRGRLAFFLWIFALANIGINIGILPNATYQARSHFGMFTIPGIWEYWKIYCASDAIRALCITAVLLIAMILPLLSTVYRGRFDAMFGIQGPSPQQPPE